MRSQIDDVTKKIRSEIAGDIIVQMRSEISIAIQRLRAELEREIGHDMLNQKVEEANNELTDAVNKEWTRYTSELESVSLCASFLGGWTGCRCKNQGETR